MNKTQLKKLYNGFFYIEDNILYSDFFILNLNKISYLKESTDKLKLIEYFKKNKTEIKEKQIEFARDLIKTIPEQKEFEYGKRAFLRYGTLSPVENTFYSFVNYDKDQSFKIDKNIIDLIVDLFYYHDCPGIELIKAKTDKSLIYIYMNGAKIGLTTCFRY